MIPNQIMLITYADCMGGDLQGLRQAMDTHFAGAAGAMHILPFFPSTADRGFAPTTYDQVEPAFGTWEDIEALSRDYFLMCDMMVNHISRSSAEFQDYLARGEDSPYAEMFFDYEKFFGGEPSPEELAKIYRRNDNPLYHDITLPDGTHRKLWRSFSTEQIDLDTDAPATREYILRNLRALGRHGIGLVRLDAYGYITKVRNTSCFFVEPKVWELIQDCEQVLRAQDMTLLPEVHAPWETVRRIAEKGYCTYDFVLPLLTLHTLYSGSATAMKEWFRVCPRNQFTVLDTHDGVGVYDAHGFVNGEEADRVIAQMEDRLSYAYKPVDSSLRKHYQSYQLYGTYYSMLHEDDNAYLLARALQFFAPGVPQVYYVGMLAGKNDLTFDPKDPRSINRHNYTAQELAEETARPVVKRLLAMMRLRNTHPAFGGELEIEETPEHRIRLVRAFEGERAVLDADLSTMTWSITYSENGKMRTLES